MNKKKIYNIICCVLFILIAIYMICKVGKPSFWCDEIDWTVNYLEMPFTKMLYQLAKGVYNLPLYYVMMSPIYHIAPYGEIWLLLPNVLLVLFSSLIMKKIGEEISGIDLGFVLFFVSITSFLLIYKGGSELRPYALMFFLSALAFLLFIKKLKYKDRKKLTIYYTLSIILLSYSHWFGCLIIPFYFLVEAYFWIKKKNKLNFIIPYIITGLTFLPWFIFTILKHANSMSKYWGKTPSLSKFVYILKFLLSDNKLCYILFIIGVIYVLIEYFIKKNKDYFFQVISIASILWCMGIIFIYSKYINPSGSLFVNRYFIVVLPQILILASVIMGELLKLNNKIKVVIVVIMLLIIMMYNLYNSNKNLNKISTCPFKEATNFFKKQQDLYSSNSAILSLTRSTYLDYYYIKSKKTLPRNIYDYNMNLIVKNSKKVNNSKKVKKKELLKYDKIYALEINYEVSDLNKNLKNFIKDNYKIIKRYPKLKIAIYEKK